MDFLVTQKSIRLKDGTEITIKRPGVGYYYRLLAAVIRRDFPDILALLRFFIFGSVSEDLLPEVITQVLEFNTVRKQTPQDFFGIKPEPEEKHQLSTAERAEMLDNLETNLSYIVESLTRRGWSIQYVTEEVNNVQVHYLMHFDKENDIKNMVNAAHAHWGGIEERISEIRGSIKLSMME